MVKIPGFILKKLYVPGSLRREGDALAFTLRNSLASASLTGVRSLRIADREIERERVSMAMDGSEVDLAAFGPEKPLPFPRNADAVVRVRGAPAAGRVKVRLDAQSAEFGDLLVEFEDEVAG